MDDNQRNALVSDCIQKHYYDDLLNVYGLTIALTETHPEQVNNEIRNALTHLARVRLAKKEDDLHEEIKRSIGHFERGKKDCLKLCIATLHERVTRTVKTIEITKGLVNSKYKLSLKSVEEQRKQAFIKESKNDSTKATSLLEKLTYDLLDIEDELAKDYPGVKGYSYGKMLWMQASSFVGKIVIGIITALVVSVIIAALS